MNHYTGGFTGYFLKECEWRMGGGNPKGLHRRQLGWAGREKNHAEKRLRYYPD